MKVCKHIKLLIFLSLMLVGVFVQAQKDKVYRAQTLLSEKKLDQAKLCIDSAMSNAEVKSMFEAWTIKAFIYFEYYKRSEKARYNSPLRDTIINSLKHSYALKPDEDAKGNNNKLINYVAGNYFNIGKYYLQDSLNYDMLTKAYAKFKETMKMAEPNYNFAVKDVEFYLAVGYVYSDIFNKDKKNLKSFEIAKVALLKVLEINPNDTSANMNMGIMYLNQATDMVESVDAGDITLEQIDIIQENAIKLAKQAEQFILKVYNQNNKNRKAVLALYYVYRVLNEPEKKLLFENKCKEMKIEVTDDPSKQKK